jgi:hypothetical protein
VKLAGEVEKRSQVAAVERMMRELDGVVGVDDWLRYRIDDRQPSEILTD